MKYEQLSTEEQQRMVTDRLLGKEREHFSLRLDAMAATAENATQITDRAKQLEDEIKQLKAELK